MTDISYGQIMSEYGIRLKKRLGQHFMVDPGLLRSIAEHMVPDQPCVVVEVGAGVGTLTRELCNRARWVYALEIDRTLESAALRITRDIPNLSWVWGDVREYDLSGAKIKSAYPTMPLVLCGNLPYYITSEIIYSAFINRSLWNRLSFVVQNEHGQRMTELPGSRQFGRLSLWCQYRSKVTMKRKIPPKAFLPPPKVDSCLINMDVYDEFPLNLQEEEMLDRVSRKVFSQRRKTIANSLVPLVGGKDKLLQLGCKYEIDLTKRPEEMTMIEYITLAKVLTSETSKIGL